MPSETLLIRPCGPDDLQSVTAIYANSVRRGTGTFELEAPSQDEMTQRWRDVQAKALPWLIAQADGQVLGFAYANHFRPRPAYRFCVEDSVYLAEAARGRGIGRALLAELMARCEALGARQMVAVIGDSANTASIALHAALGFRSAGRIDAAGWKFDRWLDVVLMQRRLGRGDTASAP